jgi:hypothetical protein
MEFQITLDFYSNPMHSRTKLICLVQSPSKVLCVFLCNLVVVLTVEQS